MSWPVSVTNSSSILDSQPRHSNGPSDIHFSEKRSTSEVPPIRVLGRPLLVSAVFANSVQGGGVMSLTLSFRCLANLLINSSAGTSKTVGNSGDVLSGSGFSSGRRGRRNIRLHRRVREFAGFLYGYLRIAPQRRHEMMIL